MKVDTLYHSLISSVDFQSVVRERECFEGFASDPRLETFSAEGRIAVHENVEPRRNALYILLLWLRLPKYNVREVDLAKTGKARAKLIVLIT